MSIGILSGRPSRRRWAVLLAGLFGLLIPATIAVGLALQAHRNLSLGTPLPPFVMSWQPHLSIELLLAAGVLGGAIALAPAALSRVRSGAVFAALSYAATLAVSLTVNATRGGSAEWARPFALHGYHAFEGRFEYVNALPVLQKFGLHDYISEFGRLLPYLPTHAKGNPPGPVVAMHLLGLTTGARLATACILVGALTTPLTYALGREFGDERRGRVAAALAVLSPALTLFGTTSADYAFAALGGLTVLLLVRRSDWALLLGGLLAGLGSFSSWFLLAMPVWAVIAVLIRDGGGAAARVAAAAAAGVLAVNLALALSFGYDPVAVVRALGPIYAHGSVLVRPYGYWVFGSPVAWLVMLGGPVAWLAARSAADRDPAALALAAVVLISSLSGFTKAETERIWLPFVPLACVAAAGTPPRRLRAALIACGVQILIVQTLFNTKW